MLKAVGLPSISSVPFHGLRFLKANQIISHVHGVLGLTQNGHVRGNSYFQLFHKLRLSQGPDPVESPRLTPRMVTAILRMNEGNAQISGGAVKEVHCNQLAANKPIEDRHVEGKLSGTDKYLFGVFDGHAGCACAQALKDRLFQYMAVSMADLGLLNKLYQGREDAASHLIEYLSTTAMDDISPDLASIHWQSLFQFVNDSLDMQAMDPTVEEALTSAFLRLDQDISTEANFHPGDEGLSEDLVNIAFSGAVGCVALIDGLDLYVANVGDSQAVVGSHSRDSNTWEATSLSHKHDSQNEKEVKRLIRRHPNESSNILRGGRLFGELMPLRAFGDVRYKWQKRDLIHLSNLAKKSSNFLTAYRDMRLPNNYRTPPYLDAEPEVMHYRLSPKDRFLILASDGLWDSDGMTVEKAVSLLGHHTEGRQVLGKYRPAEDSQLGKINSALKKRKESLAKRAVDDNAATHLIRHALGLEHGYISAQLTLPEKLVRYYRDDITITVIHFDQHYIKNFGVLH
ncbi:[Pyruvate dehydrogenase [acetyl-transferring]]-phosphatase 1, mitochondrial [Elysia marginata]|uniref:[Pyruvate dehydrogenase [acetyl-transferring]]-phosphatase 1, mitochondrial n=1 Tax=Elysia marginata TaxID=1093978 RepID=A0AAV4FRE1_9GAST|nr:[Pyruvate dehydrogenase [acetyl-transferring]]-phosphatase 1, mitochondrial [Elysia marginata]